MSAELFAEFPFRILGTGEDNQAARLVVQAVHRAYASPPFWPAPWQESG
jgi:hypothetical protein